MRLLRRLYCLVRLRRIEADLAEEIEFHRSNMQRELEKTGLSPEEASAAGARAMGNVTIAHEEARGVWLWPGLDSVFQDLRYAIRNLRRQPGFTLVAIGTLVVGIGLNTSLFTVFGAVALRPWAVMNPDRVVNVYAIPAHVPGGGTNAIGFSIAEARFLDAQSRSFLHGRRRRHCELCPNQLRRGGTELLAAPDVRMRSIFWSNAGSSPVAVTT